MVSAFLLHSVVLTSSSFTGAKPLKPTKTSSPKPMLTSKTTLTTGDKPRTIGIAGAGLAGLSTALALLKTPGTGVEHISIYEPRESLDIGLGGPLNINGGAAILTKCFGLDLWQIGRRIDFVMAKDTNSSTLFEVDVGKTVRANDTAAELLCDGSQHLFMTVMRDSLQKILYDSVRCLAVEIHRGRTQKVMKVKRTHEKACFVLASGEETPYFDLVIGADGIRSNVRTHVAGKMSTPIYSGLRVEWAIAPPGFADLKPNCIEQWFGDGGFALRYAAGSDESTTEALALTFREGEQAEENVSYKDEDKIRDDFGRRLTDCGLPDTVKATFNRATKFIETGVYYHNSIPNWSVGGRCVLVGDAAHAMAPFLGQGANQAIQDARALAVVLSKIGQDYDALDDALTAYQEIRRGVVEAIVQSSALIGNLETQEGPFGTAMRNNLFRVLGITGIAGKTFIQSAMPRVDIS